MKISRRKVDILFIFFAIIIIESISFTTYKTAVLGAKERNDLVQKVTIKENYTEFSDDELIVLVLVNNYRAEHGLSKLKTSAELQKVAELKAKDLVENNYFSHESPTLGTPFEMLNNNNVYYSVAGENLAGNISSKKAVQAWINSPAHKDNILEEDFEYTGICVVDSEVYGKVFVQLFIGINEE